MQILLLEPDKILADKYSDYLGLQSHRVDWQTQAQSAIDSIDNQKPDLIIAEMQLAQHNGVEFLYELRSYPEWQKIPVIILSSVVESEIDYATIKKRLDIYAYLYKPHTKLSKLLETINEVIPSR